MSQDLESVAEALVADGKGILAADETVPTLTKNGSIRWESAPPSRAGEHIARCYSPRRMHPTSSAASSCRMKPSDSKALAEGPSFRFFRSKA